MVGLLVGYTIKLAGHLLLLGRFKHGVGGNYTYQ